MSSICDWASVGRIFCAGSALLSAATLAGSPAKADRVAEFYRGKTIHILIGVNVGGGYDMEARLIARYIGRHIPGNPTVVPQNMIGAGGIKMANYLHAVAPQDGTAIGMFPNTLIAAQAVGIGGVQFDSSKFLWLGSVSTSPLTFGVWHTAGIRTVADAQKKEVIAAASNPGAITYTFPRMLNEMLGTKIRVVSGYQGNSTMTLAMERGEAQAVTNSWDSWRATHLHWIQEKKVHLLVQTEPKSSDSNLVNIPSVQELARNENDRRVIDLVIAGDAMGKPMAIAPNAPAERARALRAAYEATIRDPDFLKAAATAKVDVSPVAGEKLQQIVANVLSTPPELKARARKIIAE
jgi:tripartite-type tricarboxylate transporter receptor subunit TctC